MKQSHMLMRLSLKRALKNLPHMLLCSLAISAVVILAVVIYAYSNNEKAVMSRGKLAVVTNGNSLIEDIIIDALNNMETSMSYFEFISMSDKEAHDAYDSGEVDGMVLFPENYIQSIKRGENVPATIKMRDGSNPLYITLISGFADAAQEILTISEATSYAQWDMIYEYDLREDSQYYDDAQAAMTARIALSREQIFKKLVVYGEDSTTLIQGYCCVGLIMLVLLWGLSCGALIRSDDKVLTTKLETSGVSVFKQELIRFVSVFALLETVLLLVFAILMTAFPFAGEVFEQVEVYNIKTLFRLCAAFIPIVLFAAALVIFCFTAARNEIGGILLLFTLVVSCGYVSGYFMPSAFLPQTIRNIAGYLPTTYMLKLAENVLVGELPVKSIAYLLAGLVVLFAATVLIRKKRGAEA